jgi:hypothetical protein
LVIFFIIRSFYETFAQAVWVIFFHQIAKPKVEEVVEEKEVELEVIIKPMPVVNFETEE